MVNEQIRKFKSIIKRSKKIVGFTGAGISTESGIADYRSKGGIWERFKPVYFDEFLQDEEKRLLYWKRKQEMWNSVKLAKPNHGHMFFKNLYDENKLLGVITQNIDGLHEKSSLSSDFIVNLHGSTLEVICLSCEFIVPSEEIFSNLNLKNGVPFCPKCNGLFKPNTISFGQQMNPQSLERAKKLSISCDLMIVMGSTLIVHPAASFPMLAKQHAATLAIINLSETPLDDLADFVFRTKISEFLTLYSTQRPL